MKRWSHGHSIGVGALLMLLAARHLWLMVLAAFVLGILCGRLWFYESRLAASVERRFRLRSVSK